MSFLRAFQWACILFLQPRACYSLMCARHNPQWLTKKEMWCWARFSRDKLRSSTVIFLHIPFEQLQRRGSGYVVTYSFLIRLCIDYLLLWTATPRLRGFMKQLFCWLLVRIPPCPGFRSWGRGLHIWRQSGLQSKAQSKNGRSKEGDAESGEEEEKPPFILLQLGVTTGLLWSGKGWSKWSSCLHHHNPSGSRAPLNRADWTHKACSVLR